MQIKLRALGMEPQPDGGEPTEPVIEGYAAVYNSVYDMGEMYGTHMTETIAPGAFDGVTGQDVRCLIDHQTRSVLGRTKAGTLELWSDSIGLGFRCRINPADGEAMSLYSRVKRGDVDQCSFGFDIESETEVDDETGIHWTIDRIKTLYEVSICTFPAYEDTSATARAASIREARQKKAAAVKKSLLKKLKTIGRQ